MASVLIWAGLFYVLLQQVRCQNCTGCTCWWTDLKRGKLYTLDISKFFPYPYIVPATSGDYNYFYTPCETISCAATASNVCQKNISTPTTQYNCGSGPVWSITNSTYYVIRYANGGRITTVTFIGSNSTKAAKASPVVVVYPTRYSFTVTFPAASSSSSGCNATFGCVGFILISLIFVAFVAYFVVGAVIMYCKGARGIEIIPNIGFWKDIPFLIKYFTITMPIESAGESDKSGYVGFIFIILIIAAIIVFFAVGALIQYKVKGARSIEVIPNILFWRDLPFLIKDGAVFAFSPCCGQRRGYAKM